MVNIKIVSGGYGHCENGHNVLKTSGDGYFSVDDDEAARLVGLGMAAYEVEPERHVATAPEGENPAEDTGAPSLNDMTVKQLKELAESMGIDAAKMRTKAELISAIAAKNAAEDDDPGNLVI